MVYNTGNGTSEITRQITHSRKEIVDIVVGN